MVLNKQDSASQPHRMKAAASQTFEALLFVLNRWPRIAPAAAGSQE